MLDEHGQPKMHGAADTPAVDTRRNPMNTARTIKLPTRCAPQRRSEPVPISVAVAEASAAIAARSRRTTLRLRTQTGQALRKARATG